MFVSILNNINKFWACPWTFWTSVIACPQKKGSGDSSCIAISKRYAEYKNRTYKLKSTLLAANSNEIIVHNFTKIWN